MQDDPVDYDERFASGTGVNGAECVIERTWLLLPTGRVVATDPLGGRYDDLPAPFVQVVPPGRYRVDLLVMDGLIAAARLCVRDESAASWEEALPANLCDGGDAAAAGYDVNAGAGCFTDEETFRRLAEVSGSGWQLTLLEDLAWMRDGPTVIPRSEVDGSSGDEGDENVLVAFPSGEGDGTYRTLVGRTRGGEIACFVTDFLPHDA
ncbi:DUF4241 domain-containing protein [Micromonospora chokoriensis]|uniref:DUF4241 domain-containing protein n=1 Tax=Micromonospora chokoriensis TaxID=356851 RepID=A0A1C4XBL9_9ACTN|nr:DUF4241 domain-containing protein [Micromonospora chokoriensis]SCF05888.1 Protein of unknown function [Micromonospora chokoriensis]